MKSNKKRLALVLVLLTIGISVIQPFKVYAEELPERVVNEMLVTFEATEDGMISFVDSEDNSKSFKEGELCEFTVTPKDGFTIQNVIAAGADQEADLTLEDNIYSFQVTEDTNISVNFIKTVEEEKTQELSNLVNQGIVSYSNSTSSSYTLSDMAVFGMEQGVSAPSSGAALTEEICQDENIRKVLYYGWKGKEQWEGFSDNADKGIIITSLALSHYYSNSPEDISTSYYVDMGLKDFIEYCEANQNPDDYFEAVIYHTPETYQTLGGWKEILAEENRDQEEINQTDDISDKEINAELPVTKSYGNMRGADTMNVNLNFDGIGEYSVDGIATFCLEPTQQYPPSGSYTATKTNDSLLRSMLYYGYGGPGYSSALGMENQLQPGQRTYAYVLTHMALAYIYDGCSDDTDSFDGLGDDVIAQLKSIVVQANVYAGSVPSNYQAYTIYTGADSQLMSYGYIDTIGKLKLTKTSANPEITNNNSCYSLEGAVYGVYKDRACTNQVTNITTLKNGTANEVELEEGNYWVKETTAPKGFALDNQIYPITISGAQTTTLNVTDKPQSDPVYILLGKVDAEINANKPQGSASLAGAEFTVKYYSGLYNTDPTSQGKTPVRTWVLRTDEDGYITFGNEYKISGDEFFYSTSNDPIIPIGTITIQETKAPAGYLINREVFVRQITSEGSAESINTYNQPTIPEQIIRGDVELAKFGSNSLDDEQTQATPLPGVIFSLTSVTNGSVRYLVTNANGYADSTLGVYERIITDASGNMIVDPDSKYANNTRGNIPYDTYRVSELNTPDGYMPIHDFVFKLEKQSYKYQWILNDRDVTAALRVEKRDSESGNIIPVAGTTFQLLNANKEVISMVVSQYPSLIKEDEFMTDDTGAFILPEKLQAGTYYLKEIKAPEGYLKGELLKFEITDGHDWEQPFTISYYDERVKGQIHIKKTDSITGAAVPGAEYGLYAEKDIVTPDGTLHYQAGNLIKTIVTDENGEGLSGEYYCGDYYLKELSCPDVYKLDTDKHLVKIESKDDETPLVTVDIELKDIPIQVSIQKIDAVSGKGITGAQLQFLDADGRVVDEWVSDGNEHIISAIKPGKYVLHEIESPTGYYLAEDMEIFVTGMEEIQKYTMEDPRMGGIITSMHRLPGNVLPDNVLPGTPSGNVSTALKTGDVSPVGLYLLLLIGAAAVCLMAAGKNNKRRKQAIFSLFVVCVLSLQPIAAYAADLTETHEYTTKDPDDEYKGFDKILENDGNKYELADISYEVTEKQPAKEKKVLEKIVESEVIAMGEEYTPEPTVTEDGVTYELNGCTALDGSEYTQNYTEQVEYLDGANIPERRSITITDAQGNEKQIEARLTGEEILGTGEWLDTTLSITFSNYDTGVFEWQGRTIYYEDSAAPLQGYETELLRSVGADPGTNRITSTQWVGDPYVVDGVTYRDAMANVQYFVPYTRATYTGTVTYLQYAANYSAEVEENSTTEFIYTIIATANYTEQTASVGKILAVIGVGVAIVALLVVVILLLLAKQKKQQKNQVIKQPTDERSNKKWRH